MQTISWDDFYSLLLKRAMSKWFLFYMFNGKINELKEFLLLPSFIAVIRFPPPCSGGGGGQNLVMVVVVVIMVMRDYRNEVRWWRKNNFRDCLQYVLEGTGSRASLFLYGSLILSHIGWSFFSKTKTSIDLKMAKQPAKHVKSHNIARDRDYKISKPFHSWDQGKRPWHYRRWCIPL